ncbi:unnamed protein product [Acidocella sp. C78]|uniref:hypothetical protein n=1 Tax=Acidocella sp. C78 TaxID=1671486 RepID=UPI00191B95CF|nr:hypothetical protein [Acidocella sp. C78]CAG4929722.1 unnamed protein product [Acidocella sp. C78]
MSNHTASPFLFLEGGIGDFLQCLPVLLQPAARGARLIVATHQRGAEALFSGLGIEVETIFHFNDEASRRRIIEHLDVLGPHMICPRAHYFAANPFPPAPARLDGTRRTIGIHLGGSAYAVALQRQWGIPPKTLPPAILDALLPLDADLLLFGTAAEIESYGLAPRDNLTAVCCAEISDSLAHVAQCDLMIGSDSAFKTASAMLSIPTFVWLGDYADPPRDTMFIDPYVAAGIMQVFRYTDLAHPAQRGAGIAATYRFIATTPSHPRASAA